MEKIWEQKKVNSWSKFVFLVIPLYIVEGSEIAEDTCQLLYEALEK